MVPSQGELTFLDHNRSGKALLEIITTVRSSAPSASLGGKTGKLPQFGLPAV